MANINFGLLDTQYPEKLANAFIRSPEQQNANMLQVMQMQQLMDQREQAQYALGKSRREDTGMTEFGNAIKALGPNPDPLAIAQVFIKHPNPEYQLKGFELQRQAQESDLYAKANAPASGPAFGGVAPAASAPGSFGAEVATRKAQLFAPPPDRTNMMPGAAAALGEVNNLPAVVTPPQVKTQIDFLRARIDANLALGTDRGYKTAENLQKQLTELNRRYPVGNTLMGSEGNIYGTAPQLPQQPRQPNLAADLLIPGPNGTMIPNQALIKIKESLRPPGATVVMPPLEKSESQEKGKLNVKIYGVIADTADRARKILPALETSEAILNNGFKTGFSANVQTQAARVLGALGVPEAEKYATDSQVFLAQGRQALLQRQLEQKGAQSEGDAQRINQTFIQLGNTPEANKFLVATAKAQSKQDIARQKFYSNWWSKSKTYEGAEEAWLEGDGGKSLFDSPDMKQFAPKTQSSDIAAAAAAEIARRKGTSR